MVTKKLLTQKQEDFCLNYVKLRNGTNAAINAGYSPSTSHSIATENLQKPAIIQRITALRQIKSDDTIATETERKQIATAIIREQIKTPVTAKEQIMAIKELNLMGGDYAPARTDHTFNGEWLTETLLKLRGYQVPALKEGEDATE